MRAVDTNILIYSSRDDHAHYGAAYEAMKSLVEGFDPWLLPWACVHEFLSIVTHPKVFNPPTPLAIALQQVEEWLASPSVVMASEPQDYFRHFRKIVTDAKVSGGRIHDARIAAICLSHGVNEILTNDRDFNRFPTLRVIKL